VDTFCSWKESASLYSPTVSTPMLPLIVLQVFSVASVSAAAITLQVQNPLDILFGNKPWKEYPEPHPNPDKTIYQTLVADGRYAFPYFLAQALS